MNPNFKFSIGEEICFQNPWSSPREKVMLGVITECHQTATGNKYAISPIHPYYGINRVVLSESHIESFTEFDFTTVIPKLGEIVNEMYKQGVKDDIQLNTSICDVTFHFK